MAKEAPGFADRIRVLPIDVSDDASVAAAAQLVVDDFGQDPAPLYGVVNNAGIGFGTHTLEQVLQLNTLGPKRVGDAFIPLVKPSGGRVAIITSASGPSFVAKCSADMKAFFTNPKVTWDELKKLIDDCLAMGDDAQAFSERGLDDGEPYGLSKALANSVMMLLAQKHPELHINACTPGFIATDLTKPYAESQGKPPEALGMKPPEEGVHSALHLLFDELDGNAGYYGSDAKRSPLDRYRAPGDPPYTGE